jgi:hypothetical protein
VLGVHLNPTARSRLTPLVIAGFTAPLAGIQLKYKTDSVKIDRDKLNWWLPIREIALWGILVVAHIMQYAMTDRARSRSCLINPLPPLSKMRVNLCLWQLYRGNYLGRSK